jgi:glyoxylate carboligase
MTAADAAVAILRREGVTNAFGLPGAAINPFYAAMRRDGGITHTLARHVEGASHMAEGYTRARAGNIGVCVGTSGPAGTDMITGLYSASADSIPILCITGQAPVARLHKEDFQAVDIAAIAGPLTKMAMTVLEPAQVPGAFQQAFHLMRSGRPGPVLIDLPFDVQLAEIDFDIDTYEPLPVYAGRHPGPDRQGAGHAGGRRTADHRGLGVDHHRRRGGPARGVRRAHRHAGGADADGLGAPPDDHRPMAGTDFADCALVR